MLRRLVRRFRAEVGQTTAEYALVSLRDGGRYYVRVGERHPLLAELLKDKPAAGAATVFSLPDLQPREWASVVPLCAMAILMGVLPSIFLAPMEPSVRKVVQRIEAVRPVLARGAAAVAVPAPAALPRVGQ